MEETPEELAKAAYKAHGGEKLRNLKSLEVYGTVDVTTSALAQAIPGSFAMIISGDRYLLTIQTPIQSIKQVFDGKQTQSTIPQFALPPVNSLGFPLLARLGQPGISIGPAAKKGRGFRLTAPDGFYTDFYLDSKTGLIKSFESAYEVYGRKLVTVAEVDKNQVVEGITIPQRYSQRFELGTITAYSDFKAKEIKVNSLIDDKVFSLSSN
ncbi:MAG TPA: hypothetical protein VNK26_08120 [Pyrinomonadaceae bacterium]|nr:hypothetical protein [Pyrinomonadaceae bacterium]